MEEIFEVNANGDIEDMDLCDFTKDTPLTPAPPKNQGLHPPYYPLHQKSIPPHHPAPNKNNPKKKNPNPKP